MVGGVIAVRLSGSQLSLIMAPRHHIRLVEYYSVRDTSINATEKNGRRDSVRKSMEGDIVNRSSAFHNIVHGRSV